MKRLLRLTESQLGAIIAEKIQQQNEADPNRRPGSRGRWKDVWYREDQLLAMYNALYGFHDLGHNAKEIAENIIGSSVDAFIMQTSNFKNLNGEPGNFDRPNSTQTEVWEKYKGYTRNQLLQKCKEIIENRLANPDIAVIRKKLGKEIGDKREAIIQGRLDALIKAGMKPEKANNMIKMGPVKSEPKNLPEPEEISTERQEIEGVKDYLQKIHNSLINANSIEEIKSIANEIAFVIEYIEDVLVDKTTSSMVAEIRCLFKNLI